MAKDPAVLWYWNDWSGGTITMSRFLKGCYMDLLHAQFNNGNLSLTEIKTVLGSDFGAAWPTLQKKFKNDGNGLYFNERLVTESIKRKSFTKSRRNNLNGSSHMDNHMEDVNENKSLSDINLLKERKEKFSIDVLETVHASTTETTYDIKVLNEFIEYWTEHNSKGKKMRFEMEKVFDISRRWATWIKNNEKFTKKENGTSKTDSTIASVNRLINGGE